MNTDCAAAEDNADLEGSRLYLPLQTGHFTLPAPSQVGHVQEENNV
jgi:hypothetical protein